MAAPSVSLIIPTLNEELYLPRLLDSLRGITSPLDIIVVDGASVDGTADVVEKYRTLFTPPSSLSLIRSPERGTSLQRNLGAEKAKYLILLFCDADIVFPSVQDYENLVSEFDRKGYVVANPILTPLEPGLHRKASYRMLTSAQKGLFLLGKPNFAGGCLLTTKAVFEKTGGFDTGIVLAEDIDYSRRAAKYGSFGMIRVRILVSDRRNITYGYWWVLSQIPNLFRLLFTGRLKPDTIYYPFGGYSGHEPHHVTANRGRQR